MMEKDATQRTQSAGEVASRLEPWAMEASPITTEQMVRSPWTPPPLPTGFDDDQATDVGLGELEEYGVGRQESSSQLSQGTFPFASASQETRLGRQTRRVKPPPLSMARRRHRDGSGLSRLTSVAIALAVAVPTALMLGVAIGFLLHAAIQ
jgi:hypothetical protein